MNAKKAILLLLMLALPLISMAGTGGPSDDELFILSFLGLLCCIAAIIQLPGYIDQIIRLIKLGKQLKSNTSP
jgi:hypothetical protein